MAAPRKRGGRTGGRGPPLRRRTRRGGACPPPNRDPDRSDPPTGPAYVPGLRGADTPRSPPGGDAAAKTPPLAAGADVDCGQLAGGQRLHETFGGKPPPVTAPGRERRWASPSLAPHTPVRKGPRAGASPRWKGGLGNSVGANGCPRESRPFARRRAVSACGRGALTGPPPF